MRVGAQLLQQIFQWRRPCQRKILAIVHAERFQRHANRIALTYSAMVSMPMMCATC